MKNKLERLWKSNHNPVGEVVYLETINNDNDVDIIKNLSNLAAKLKEQAPHDQEIATLVNRTSTLLEVLNSNWVQIINSSLPFVSIGVHLLKFYLEKTQQKLPLSQSVALVTQSAYLSSLQTYLQVQSQSNIVNQLKINEKEASDIVKKEINKLADLELTDAQAKSTLLYFPESELAVAFNKVLSFRLQDAEIEEQDATTIAQTISNYTPHYIEQVLAEGAESLEKIREWYRLGDQEVFESDLSVDTYLESDLSIDTYLKNEIAALPQQKVFDEEFSFQDIYVPLKAKLLEAHGEDIYNSDFFVLQDWVKEKIVDDKDKDKVIVIQAEPGGGKSLFCQMFAEQVSQELHPKLTPIFIRLRDIQTFEANFEQTLKTVLNSDVIKIDDGWLKNRNINYLFILDGFDELRLQVRNLSGLEQFLRQIAYFQKDMAKSPETGHRVILTGRTIAFQGISLPRNLTQVKIQKMDKILQDKWLEKWQKVVDKDTKIAAQKTQAFTEFLNNNNCPKEIKDDLVGEPLLLYLLGAMHRDGSIKLEDFLSGSKIQSKITIYEQSLQWVLSKQRDKWLKADITGLEEDNFEEVMELILTESAIAVVQSGGESAQLKMIEERLNNEDVDLVKIIEEFQEKEKYQALNNALGAFYIQAAEKKERHMKFYHKSFSEFLCARRLYHSLEEWTEKAGRRHKWIVDDIQLAQQIYDLFGYGSLSVEILQYLRRLLEKSADIFFIDLFTRLENFYRSWCEGKFINAEGTNYPQKKMRDLKSYVSPETKLGQRQVDLFTGLNVMILLFELHRYGQKSSDENLKQQLSFHPCGKIDADGKPKNPDLLLRLIGYSYCLDTKAFTKIVGKFLDGANFGSVNLNSSNLEGAYLRSSNLRSSNLVGANLRSAYLRSACLRSANLRSANLRSANLRSANLNSANLRSAYLVGANLRSAYVINANLRGADLRNSNLRSCNLEGAYLVCANFKSANLRSANLISANLRSADLKSANLKSAYLVGANLRSADLTGADLRNANLRSADLTNITWDNETDWNHVRGLATAINVPEKLKKYLGIE